MPTSYTAYSFSSSLDELEKGLAEPLYVEIWHRDLYRKVLFGQEELAKCNEDSVVGIGVAEMSPSVRVFMVFEAMASRVFGSSP